jgi:hypothetical protein
MGSRTPPSEALAAWLPAQRWFGTKTRAVREVSIEDAIPLGPGALAIARVTLDDGAVDRYCLALLDGGVPAAGDALDDPRLARALLDLALTGMRVPGRGGELVGRPSTARAPALPGSPAVRKVGGEQSNTSIALGDALMLYLFRSLAV